VEVNRHRLIDMAAANNSNMVVQVGARYGRLYVDVPNYWEVCRVCTSVRTGIGIYRLRISHPLVLLEPAVGVNTVS